MSASDAIWRAAYLAEHGGDPEACMYCGLEARTLREWDAGAACSRCGGTLDVPPPLPRKAS